ncbi:MAG: hypothetical protein EHM57_05515, partial [Actinobacteria bacterium]
MSVVVIVLAVLAVAIVVAVVVALSGRASGRREGGAAPEAPPTRVRPAVAAFHVRGDAAHVEFAVPLPAGDPGDHMRRLLEHEAIAVLREKRHHGLPVEEVAMVVVYAQRDGAPVEVGRIEPETDTVPEVVAPDLMPHAPAAGFDPLARLGEHEFEMVPGVEVSADEGSLPPISQSIELSGPTADALRAQGIDPGTASLSSLTLGLLQTAGYQVSPVAGGPSTETGTEGKAYRASRGGTSTLIAILESQPGEYPMLSERAINEMIVLAAQNNLGGFL